MPTSPPRGPGRPPRLSRERIVAAALELDLAGLTTRELAARLGVSHSALYRWVPSRDALLGMVTDALIDRVLPVDDPVDGDWRTWLRDLGLAMRESFLAVRGFPGQIVAPHEHGEGYERLESRVVGVLERHAGVSRDLAVQCWFVFGTSVMGWLAVEQHREAPLDPAPRFDVLLAVLVRGMPPDGFASDPN
jgi:AcrR family transcriptional regulator